jgi:hypothetical protein
MKFISDKHNGPIAKDFSIERSAESFCTDSSMRSNYDEKLAEASRLAEEHKANKSAKFLKNLVNRSITGSFKLSDKNS